MSYLVPTLRFLNTTDARAGRNICAEAVSGCVSTEILERV